MTVKQITASLRLWERREAAAHRNHLASKARGDHARERVWIDREREAERMIARRRDQLAAVDKTWKPPMVTAEQLGLRFQYVFGPKGPVTRCAGHYTAGPRRADATGLAVEARNDHAFHAGKGWGGLSYEWMIADDGTLLLGNPTDRKSAAVALNNTGTVNICCPGTTGDKPTAAQARTLRWLLANAHTSALPKAHRSPVDLRRVPLLGHREFPNQATACPGDFLSLYRSRGEAR